MREMSLNYMTDREALEQVISLSKRLPIDKSLPLVERYRDKDALSVVISIAESVIVEKRNHKKHHDEDGKEIYEA